MSIINYNDYVITIRKKIENIIFISFEIIISNKNSSGSFNSFWELIFEAFKLVSIKINKSGCFIIIGVVINHNDDTSLQINANISKIKIIAVKNFPDYAELILIKKSASWHANVIKKSKYITYNKESKLFSKYFSFKNIRIHGRFDLTLKGLTNNENVNLFISSQNTNSLSLHCTIILTTYEQSHFTQVEQIFMSILNNLPSVSGVLTPIPSKNVVKNPGRYTLGFSDYNINKFDILKILKHIPLFLTYKIFNLIDEQNESQSIIESVDAILHKKSIVIYPWLGFQEYSIR